MKEPKVVKALFVNPTNRALGRSARQSSVYNSLDAMRAVDGNTDGGKERNCAHTQMDPQAWWEVDLGCEVTILAIKVWNRSDEPFDPAREKDTYTKRIVPCWVMVSHFPFGDLVGGKSLEIALKKCEARKRFNTELALSSTSFRPAFHVKAVEPERSTSASAVSASAILDIEGRL